jgi:hypothetical protein
MKQETYPVALFKTKTAIRQHLEPAVRALNNQSAEPVHVAATLGDVIQKYMKQNLPKLAKSTQDTQNGQLQIHIKPKWGDRALTEIHPGDVQAWIQTVNLSQVSKGNVMVIMRRLFKLAMLWGMYPVGLNPLSLVEVKGATKREEEPTILTPAQVTRFTDTWASGPPRTAIVSATTRAFSRLGSWTTPQSGHFKSSSVISSAGTLASKSTAQMRSAVDTLSAASSLAMSMAVVGWALK